jgi:hypothetical protein
VNLYKITISAYVTAENESGALLTPIDPTASDVDIEKIEDKSQIDCSWLNALPFGSKENKLCCDFFNVEQTKETEELKMRKNKQPELFSGIEAAA